MFQISESSQNHRSVWLNRYTITSLLATQFPFPSPTGARFRVDALWRCVPNAGFTSNITFDIKCLSIDRTGATEQLMATASAQVPEFPVGSLVRIRERDWIVLPSDDRDIICLRPLSGSESEICGIHREIEGHALKHAEFAPPK